MHFPDVPHVSVRIGPAQAWEILVDMGFSEEVADCVGERVLDNHGNLASVDDVVLLLHRTPGVDPEAPLLVRQLLRKACVREAGRKH